MQPTGSLFLSLNIAEGPIPSRIQVVPAGTTLIGRDGRVWKNPHPQEVVRNSVARLGMLPIDENHATDLAAPQGGAAPALGWMKQLCTDTQGAIWAEVEWTDRGREALSKKEYRYLSPVFTSSASGEIQAILRAALTNNPNLSLPALNSEQPGNPAKEKPMHNILAALGLAETATEQEAIALIQAMRAQLTAASALKKPTVPIVALAAAEPPPCGIDLAVYAPRTDLNAMEARALAAEKQLVEMQAAQFKQEVANTVDTAIKNRKIAPASKQEYIALCATKEALETFKKVVGISPELISNEPQVPAGVPQGETVNLNAAEAAVMKAAGYTAAEWQTLKGGMA
ncbi:MAG: phage protease [Treponema sp.]|jgi:phage I-like protein|nr:phage protease [Treponema sp.]